MEWKPYPEETPGKSGNYIASIHRPRGAGKYVFESLTHYDSEKKAWFKYDPYLDGKYEPKEDVTDLVVGWVSDLGSYGGVPK